MKRKLTFLDLTSMLAFGFALLDVVLFSINNYSPPFALKYSISFLCLNLMINQLKS
jgi:hypothetical protein